MRLSSFLGVQGYACMHPCMHAYMEILMHACFEE